MRIRLEHKAMASERIDAEREQMVFIFGRCMLEAAAMLGAQIPAI